MNKSTVQSIYEQTKQLFPISDEPHLQYVRQDWIFPNHIDIMIDIIEDMCQKYGGDSYICTLAAILHDTGLVYKRTSASSRGHEQRSEEYAKKMLEKHEVDEDDIESIISSISATNPKQKPTSINQKIVRTADALSQFISIHFIAKAHFAKDWDAYLKWVQKKMDTNYAKICFTDEQKQAKTCHTYITHALKLYQQHNTNKD